MTRSTGTLALCLVAMLLPAAATARKAPPAPAPDPVTARMVVDKQLAAQSKSGPGLSSIEARRIRERYLARIGVALETDNDASSGRGRQ